MNTVTTIVSALRKGVGRIKATGHVPGRDDLAVASRLKQVFEARHEFGGLRFYVKQGVVEVFGTLDSRAQEALLEGTIRSLPGVTGVRLHVQHVLAELPEALPSLDRIADREPVEVPRPLRRRARLATA